MKKFTEVQSVKLSAAAPEMYALLRLLADYLNDIIDDPEDFRCTALEKTYALLKYIDSTEVEND